MGKSTLGRVLIGLIAALQLSGCVVRPWWGPHDRGRHHGEYHHERHGEHYRSYGDHGDHY